MRIKAEKEQTCSRIRVRWGQPLRCRATSASSHVHCAAESEK